MNYMGIKVVGHFSIVHCSVGFVRRNFVVGLYSVGSRSY